MRVLGKYVVIEEKNDEHLTDSGLIVSSDEADFNLRYRRGVVISPGVDVGSLSAGDEIYYDKNAGFKLLLESKSRLVILERDVVVVL
jgi:co-chaperonin GroES (HSP10)